MADLKKVLSKLSQEDQKKKPTKKKEKVEEPVEEEEEVEEEDEALEEDEEEEDEDDAEETETVTSEPTEKLSDEEIKRLQAIDQEITRLRDHGVYNAEALFQQIQSNEYLGRIAVALEQLLAKFDEADGSKKK